GYIHLHATKQSWYHNNIMGIYPTPAEDVKLTLTGTGGVKGRVVDAAGKPVGKGNIEVYPAGERIGKWGGSMQVRTDGTFAFDGVPPGHYLVSTDPRAGIPGQKVKTQEIDVTAGKTTEVEVPASH